MKIYCFANIDWIIANDIDEALKLAGYNPDDICEDEIEELIEELSDNHLLTIICNDEGIPDETGTKITKTAKEWVTEFPNLGLLCSTEF